MNTTFSGSNVFQKIRLIKTFSINFHFVFGIHRHTLVVLFYANKTMSNKFIRLRPSRSKLMMVDNEVF